MSARAPGARTTGDEGIAMLEFALVVPFLLLMLFGLIEFGLAWRADNRVDTSTANAARVAASSGQLSTADRDTLVALKATLPSDLLAKLDRVVIYRSDAADGAVPTTCVPAFGSTSDVGVNTASVRCNSYSGATVRAVSSSSMTGFGGTTGSKDAYWAPSARKDTILGPPDYVGVYVRTVYEDTTVTFWNDITLTDNSVFRIQPDFTGI
jgi:Flp pilus assembly protein TadG